MFSPSNARGETTDPPYNPTEGCGAQDPTTGRMVLRERHQAPLTLYPTLPGDNGEAGKADNERLSPLQIFDPEQDTRANAIATVTVEAAPNDNRNYPRSGHDLNDTVQQERDIPVISPTGENPRGPLPDLEVAHNHQETAKMSTPAHSYSRETVLPTSA